MEELRTCQWDGLCAGERLAVLERLETVRRKATACSYDLGLAVQRCSTEELGGRAATVIADVLRISPRESTRRLREAAAAACQVFCVSRLSDFWSAVLSSSVYRYGSMRSG